MFSSETHEQTIMSDAQGGYLGISVESFLIDRQAASLSAHTLKFYRQFLTPFITCCNANSLRLVQDVSPDFLRRYLLGLSENHNPGGVHAAFRTLRVFFRWLTNEEVMPPDWKNPILKVKPPKVAMEPLEPISYGRRARADGHMRFSQPSLWVSFPAFRRTPWPLYRICCPRLPGREHARPALDKLEHLCYSEAGLPHPSRADVAP
jgi:hypothetical protein